MKHFFERHPLNHVSKAFLKSYFGQRVLTPLTIIDMSKHSWWIKVGACSDLPPWFGQSPKFGSFFFDGFPKELSVECNLIEVI